MADNDDHFEAIKNIEYPFFKVPYDQFNKKFRDVHRALEKSAESRQFIIYDDSPDTAISSLNAVINRLIELQTFFNTELDNEQEYCHQLQKRVAIVRNKQNPSFQQEQSSRLIVNYLQRCGYHDTALAYSKHENLDYGIDLETLAPTKSVESSLLDGDLSPCLSWCQDNKSRLKKCNSNLESNLRQQEFIKLVEANNIVEAITYMRKYGKIIDPDQKSGIQHLMGLIAFSTIPKYIPSRYQSYHSPCRWSHLADLFKDDQLRMFHLPGVSLFILLLQTGLAMIRTRDCRPANETPESRYEGAFSSSCPACHDSLCQIAAHVPFANFAQSRFRCRITGETINENNKAVVLPNGQLFGENGLEQMVKGNKVTCPMTGKVFDMKEVLNAFIM